MMYRENVESRIENMGGFRINIFREKKSRGSYLTFHRHRSRYNIVSESSFECVDINIRQC